MGHSRLEAEVWFLGMQEAGGGEANIRIRLKFRPVMDNPKAHKMLGVTHLHWGRRRYSTYLAERLTNYKSES